MAEKTELAPREEISAEVLRPIASPQQLLAQWQTLQELKSALITESDTYQDERGATRLKISGWRKFGIAFGLSSRTTYEEVLADRDDPREFVGRVRMILTHRGGRAVEGLGYFSSREVKHKWLPDGSCVHPTRTDKRGDPIPVPLEHTVMARAHTRALKRATQDMIGPVEQEDEELEEPEPARIPSPEARATQSEGFKGPGPRKPDAGQRAIVVQWLEQVLGDELAELVDIGERDGELWVRLDWKRTDEHGHHFQQALRAWGYEVNDTRDGLIARIGRSKA